MFNRQEIYEQYANYQLWGLRLATRADILPHTDVYVVKIDRFGQIMRRPSRLRFGMEPLQGERGAQMINAYYTDRHGDPHGVPTIPLSEFLGETEMSTCLFLVPLPEAMNEEIVNNIDCFFGLEAVVGYDLSRGMADISDPFDGFLVDEFIC